MQLSALCSAARISDYYNTQPCFDNYYIIAINMVLSNISSVNRNMTLSFGRCLDILSVSVVAPADQNTIIVCDVFTML